MKLFESLIKPTQSSQNDSVDTAALYEEVRN